MIKTKPKSTYKRPSRSKAAIAEREAAKLANVVAASDAVDPAAVAKTAAILDEVGAGVREEFIHHEIQQAVAELDDVEFGASLFVSVFEDGRVEMMGPSSDPDALETREFTTSDAGAGGFTLSKSEARGLHGFLTEFGNDESTFGNSVSYYEQAMDLGSKLRNATAIHDRDMAAMMMTVDAVQFELQATKAELKTADAAISVSRSNESHTRVQFVAAQRDLEVVKAELTKANRRGTGSEAAIISLKALVRNLIDESIALQKRGLLDRILNRTP